jgi:hypothetical protein
MVFLLTSSLSQHNAASLKGADYLDMMDYSPEQLKALLDVGSLICDGVL